MPDARRAHRRRLRHDIPAGWAARLLDVRSTIWEGGIAAHSSLMVIRKGRTMSELSPNPLLINIALPAYDRIEPRHIAPAVHEILTRCRKILGQIESATAIAWSAIFEPMESIDRLLEYGWSPIGHLLSVANSDELRVAHEAALPQIIEFSLQLRQSAAIYAKLRGLRDSPQWSMLVSAQQRIITRMIQTAELSGVSLRGEQRVRFNEIEQTLAQIGTTFSNNVLDATKAWHLDVSEVREAEGWPASLRRMTAASWSAADENNGQAAATPALGPWRITLDAPCFMPFMEHCRKRDLRETLYRAYLARASSGSTDNSPLITRILQLKHEQAALLGFDSYAALSLSQKMAGNVQAVEQMFEQLLAVSLDAGKQELAELTAFAQTRGHTGPLVQWDLAFWAERLREQKYAYTDEELRPYFSLDRVLRGLFELCRKLFGIHVSAADNAAPVWNPDVRFYHIDDESGRRIASFYLDPYSRPQNKRGGAWMNDCLARSVGPLGVQLPVAHLICNSTPPSADVPSLMTFREVETLFHEFGHGLQHMLTTVDYRDAAGISGVEWDAVELPSQFMENWCLHRETLLGMALHYQTEAPLPEALFEKLGAAKTYRAGSNMLRQLQLGMVDIALHHTYDPADAESPFALAARVAARTSLLPPLPEDRFLCSFQHIFAGGYAAGYYSYKWAEVLSADAFAAFEEAGLDNLVAISATGRRYRDTILAQGGSRQPMEIFRDFRGREPSTAALLKHNGLVAA